MEDNVNSAKIGETPHVPCHNKKRVASTRSSYESGDSGYITQTPNSANSTSAYTPVAGSNCRPRLSACSNGTASIGRRRYPRVRTMIEPWQSERATRLRSKLKDRLDGAETGDSSAGNNVLGEYRDGVNGARLNSELEGLLRAHNEEVKTSVPKTPAANLQLLSPPPSPAVPSLSFVATEPIEDDVEMKLVIVPQSTPHGVMPGNLNKVNKTGELSPTTSRPSPIFSSVESHGKLSKLMITDLTMSEIKPKRLDFSQRPKILGHQRSRAVPYLGGERYVDFMSILGEESDHWRVVAKILGLLTPQDLCSISMVSKTWRRICARDTRANVRRHHYAILRQNVKENLKLIRAKAKAEGDVVASPGTRFVRKGCLVEVQNLIQPHANVLTPGSPPVSPSKVKFHSFVKAGRALEPSEHLFRCPKCLFACHVDGEKNIASCSRQGCSMEFCTCCSSRHTGPCKTALLATPTKRNKRLIAGSRQSKRNLRRL